jgi:hypothetical protein
MSLFRRYLAAEVRCVETGIRSVVGRRDRLLRRW